MRRRKRMVGFMLRKKKMAAVALFLVLALGAWALAAGQLVEQKSVLTGKVLANGLAVPNTQVREGDVLVNISTVTGSTAVAARAAVNGTVREVLVKPGDTIRAGDVVVRIQANN